ncbi:MAG: ubiquinone biosynthesis regulatory protein kinase UbiB [Gammaproteobacteria bacterium]|nr:ubiquinone biosynthesis regulatory protein kinase UbiB [Gammaproteobacteria bacterium]MCW8840581.1 ubiquinone biosynthesis regulatory protein kinase UbiB [Gammaproteobacteria bacterium]MCW8927186.1 ubiquinone biosynthesis regulatory protein kinase UbiB [Gammaproteobacteria bacterium]MCW8959102.1 ubiquinone biosynthesis regulatory protein kinase UbiB [Gammaproteobacteria bacterium]MCW8973397.1 ubiquinone biosynthesis regulatory protein kinase UbiB [Gammaproteobacteria bacterium]
MIRPGQALRLFYISWTLLRHGLDELILASHLFRPLHFLRWFMWWRVLRNKELGRGVRIRRALEDLGPIFVKFGQILSTRRDLLPDDISLELAALQDRVPPFPGRTAVAILEKAYGKPLDQVFAEFNPEPLASASIAQVHVARLLDGTEVVVKVVRPDIEPVIRRDIGLLYIIADKLQRYWSEGRRLRPLEVVGEFEKTIIDELDLMREAASATLIRRNFADSELLYVPEVYWPYCRRNVMVMERISGIPVSNIEAIREAEIDLKSLASRGVEIFFTQVFRHNFFHADMHPGNIFVSPAGQYMAVDFGIVGTLSHDDQRYLAENFLAFFKRDYQRVAELHVESGWVPATTRVDEFEAAIRTVCEPIFERPLAEISFGQLLLRLFQTARRFNMEVQPQLVLLQKTLLNIEGLGRQLYPELDLWQTAKPFLERWMSEQIGTRAFFNRLKDNVPQWGEKLPEIPALVHEVLHQARNGKLEVRTNSEELQKIRREMRRANQRTFFAILGGSLIISAALIFGLDGYAPPIAYGAPVATWGLGILGTVILLLNWPGRGE